MCKISVIGAGSWGTALAQSLCKNGHKVTVYGRDQKQIEAVNSSHINEKYLPGIVLDEKMSFTSDLPAAVEGRNVLVMAVSTQSFRSVFQGVAKHARKDVIIVNTAKGIELGTHMRISQIVEAEMPGVKFAVLSGPTHAEEVVKGLPASLISASEDLETAKRIQDLFMGESLRVYTSEDVVGVELGGALKNIIALGAGISDGMHLGDNAKAALETRGLVEMARLGEAMGAKASTFTGLAGVGDLIVTCGSMHSRNRRCGMLLGQGVPADEAIRQIGMVVEGMTTTNAAYDLSKEYGVEMPITNEIYQLLNGKTSVKDSIAALMGREKKSE